MSGSFKTTKGRDQWSRSETAPPRLAQSYLTPPSNDAVLPDVEARLKDTEGSIRKNPFSHLKIGHKKQDLQFGESEEEDSEHNSCSLGHATNYLPVDLKNPGSPRQGLTKKSGNSNMGEEKKEQLGRQDSGGLLWSRSRRISAQDLSHLKKDGIDEEPDPKQNLDHDNDSDGDSVSSMETEDGVIGIGIPQAGKVAAPSETPPRSDEEATQRALSHVVAMNMAEEEHNSKSGKNVVSSMFGRRRSSTRAPSNVGDTLLDVKRQERERSASSTAMYSSNSSRQTVAVLEDDLLARKRIERTSSSSQSSRRHPPARFNSNDSGDSQDESYRLALTRASLRSREEQLKLCDPGHDGPTLAPGVSTGSTALPAVGLAFADSEAQPGASFIAMQQRFEKGVDAGPSLAPASSNVRSESPAVDPNEVLEVHSGVPVILPGAFAIEGMDAATNSSSVFDQDDEVVDEELPLPQVTTVAQPTPASLPDEEAPPLEAELQVVVDGAVVRDEDEIVDPKALRRMRFVQMFIACFSVAAVALIVAAVVGFTKVGQDGNESSLGWVQVGGDIFGPQGEPQVLFGKGVALSGNGTRAAITAPGYDESVNLNVGQVCILDKMEGANGTEWDLKASLQGEESSDQPLLSVSMSKDGRHVVVGRPLVGHGGQVEVYEELEQAWSSVGVFALDNEDVDSKSWFGYGLDLTSDGSIVAIGAPLAETANGERSGLVRVLLKANQSWTQLGQDIVGFGINDFLGWSLAITSTSAGTFRMVAGGPGHDSERGHVRVFDSTESTWTQVGSTLLGAAPLARFGESVALSEDGSVMAVGARGTAFEPGQASVFRHQVGGDWVADAAASELLKGQEPSEGYGAAVSLSEDGTVLVVGAPQSSAGGINSGRVSVFQFDGTAWAEVGRTIVGKGNEEFGSAVAVSSNGTRLLIGAPSAAFDGSIARAGTARVYDREE